MAQHLAATADLLGLCDLYKRGPAVSDREKQLWIYLTTGGDVAPVHGVPFLAWRLVIGAVRHAHSVLVK
jgi:hypothetical protein